MKQIYLPDFLESIAEQAEYLGQEASPEIAERFIDAVRETAKQLAKTPYLGFNREFTNHKLRNVRVWRVKDFEKYLIFYIPKQDSIEFVYLIHSARDYSRIFDDE